MHFDRSRARCGNRRWSAPGTSSRFCFDLRMATALTVWLLATCLATPVAAQTITVVGTQHLTGLEPPPSAEQLEHAVQTLASFEPTQV